MVVNHKARKFVLTYDLSNLMSVTKERGSTLSPKIQTRDATGISTFTTGFTEPIPNLITGKDCGVVLTKASTVN